MRRFKIKIKRRLTEGRILLNEITFASAVNNLGSKKNKKMIRRWIEAGRWADVYGIEPDDPLYKYQQTLRPIETQLGLGRLGEPVPRSTRRQRWDSFPSEIQDGLVDKYARHFRNWLMDVVPDDLEDNQKGLVVTWLNRLSRDPETGYLDRFLSGDAPTGDTWNDIEMFFHYQQFMAEKDLNRIADLSELEQIVLDARDDIKVYQEKRSYADAGEGTEVLRDDDEFYIAAIHNKGAACSLGKGTDWCTAAPGLDYFSEYYRPEDPLFFFQQKKYSQDDVDRPPQRYQFHYGSLQFMDENDHNLDDDAMHALHRRLMQTEAPNKYPILKKYDRKVKIEREDTSPEDLHQLVEDDMTHYEELVDIALHSNVSEESLRKLMVVADPKTPDYVGGGDQRHATALKSAVARGAHTPELLEDLWQITKSAASVAAEETEKRLRGDQKHFEEKFGPNWAEERLPLQLRIARGHHAAVWKSIAFNPNVSNDLLKQIAEYDGGEYLKTFAAEKILAREEGFVGEKELRPIQIRGRVVRRKSDEEGIPAAARWDEEMGQRLAESKIYTRWKKIIN